MNISEKLKVFWHGGDYNPDQWLDRPDILEDDIKFAKAAGCNALSVGIFAWSALEPREGEFHFEWLDSIIDNLYKNGIYTVLATPTGAMPPWMPKKYPEVTRTNYDGFQKLYGVRHNNCFSSPVYREKTRIINTKLAERYAKHPGVVMWHLSNEYNGGDCHCKYCSDGFRNWLKQKYGTVKNLNAAYGNAFWSHLYSEWEEISPPNPLGETLSLPLELDWRRYKSQLVTDFIDWETAPLKAANPDIPTTANLMRYTGLDYHEISKHIDVVSWDNYPEWYRGDMHPAISTAFWHTMFKGCKKDKPFMMMESSPSATNWQATAKLRRPGQHKLSSLQAVAHGSDTVQYFQFRKSRGQSEKFHGAVIGHDNSCETRVFKDVAEVGQTLKDIKEICGSLPRHKVAILHDFDNIWAIENTKGFKNTLPDKGYENCLLKHFGALWELNVGTDVISQNDSFDGYEVIIAPMMYMLKTDAINKIEEFVKNGGVFIATYITGLVDENDKCYIHDSYFPLRDVLGIVSEEIDSLCDDDKNSVTFGGITYECRNYCDLVNITTAKPLAVYNNDFYAGKPALCKNKFGAGTGYYIASDIDSDMLTDFYAGILSDYRIMETADGVNVQIRCGESCDYVFIMNFNAGKRFVTVPYEKYEILHGSFDSENRINPYGTVILKVNK